MTQPESTETAGNAAAQPPAAATPNTSGTPPGKTVVPATTSRWIRRERAAADALRGFIRDLYESQFGAVAPASGEVTLDLRMKLDPANAWAAQFESSLAEQVLPQLQLAHSRAGIFHEGRVYCFKCESSECAHSVPPDPLAVFAGYDPMGLAEWKELAQVLVEARDPRVEDLFGKPPRPVARVQFGRDVKERQLSTFGRSSRTYSILGQVCAGYFETRGPDVPDRFALTAQVVEICGTNGRAEIRFNWMAGGMDARALSAWCVEREATSVARARDLLRSQVERLHREADVAATPERRRQVLRRIPHLLEDFAGSLRRGRRQEERRTHHVEHRRTEDQRPVHKALEDAAGAPANLWFRDKKPDTLVVCGPQGRAHVFNLNGQHVTSFVLPPGGMDQRVRRGRWTPAAAEDRTRLLEAFRAPGISEPSAR